MCDDYEMEKYKRYRMKVQKYDNVYYSNLPALWDLIQNSKILPGTKKTFSVFPKLLKKNSAYFKKQILYVS